jgi:hypothetical protein
MRIVITQENRRWFATIFDDSGVQLFKSKAEMRAGCAARVGFNYVQGVYGAPSTDTFVIDVSEW